MDTSPRYNLSYFHEIPRVSALAVVSESTGETLAKQAAWTRNESVFESVGASRAERLFCGRCAYSGVFASSYWALIPPEASPVLRP